MPVYVPTKHVLGLMVDGLFAWPDLVREMDNAESITPVAGYERRQRWCGQRLQAYVEPGTWDGEDALFIVGVRERARAEEPSEHQVVGRAVPAQRSRRSGGVGRRWPSTWRELTDRLKQHEGVRVLHGGKHMIVTRHHKRIFTMPISASDHRGIRNACLQLQRLGIDVSR